jgi:hypothetical protein
MPALSKSPSIRTFVAAWTEHVSRKLLEAAGKDGRLSASEAAHITEQETGAVATGYLLDKAQKSVTVTKMVRELTQGVEAAARVAAGIDGRLSATDAFKLPERLRDVFHALQSQMTPINAIALLAGLTPSMVNMSESDSPVITVNAGVAPKGAVTADWVAAQLQPVFARNKNAMAGGARSVDDGPLEQQPVSLGSPGQFLAQREQAHDPGNPQAEKYAAQWRALGAAVRANLSQLQLFRFGTVEATYVLVGRTSLGEIAGFMTGAVET